MNAEELLAKAINLAEADLQSNGCYLNAPYKLLFNGTHYIARVKRHEREPIGKEPASIVTRIAIEQPVTHVISGMVNNAD